MILEIMAAMVLLVAVQVIGSFSFGAAGAVIGAVFAKDEERGSVEGAWWGIGAFWVVLLIVALVVTL